MPKLVMGKTPEQLKREADQREQERLANIQEQDLEQQRQLRDMVVKQKRNRYIVLSISVILIIALLVFGTYNTFFKDPLNTNDVANVVYQFQSQLPDYSYPGLDGFIRSNFDKWYNDQLQFDPDKKTDIEYIKGDLNTIAIDEIRHDGNNALFARVYFSIDIETKKVDTFDQNKEVIVGETTRTRTRFYIPIEYHYNRDANGQALTVGYAAIGRLSYYMLENTDQHDYLVNDWFKFNEEAKYSPSESALYEPARIRVEKILKDMYNGVVDESQYSSVRKFVNENGVKYVAMNQFDFYSEPNAMGFNAYVAYTIETKEGFTYENVNYLRLKQVTDGQNVTWVIESMI